MELLISCFHRDVMIPWLQFIIIGRYSVSCNTIYYIGALTLPQLLHYIDMLSPNSNLPVTVVACWTSAAMVLTPQQVPSCFILSLQHEVVKDSSSINWRPHLHNETCQIWRSLMLRRAASLNNNTTLFIVSTDAMIVWSYTYLPEAVNPNVLQIIRIGAASCVKFMITSAKF